jgi:hypothetical protein
MIKLHVDTFLGSAQRYRPVRSLEACHALAGLSLFTRCWPVGFRVTCRLQESDITVTGSAVLQHKATRPSADVDLGGT